MPQEQYFVNEAKKTTVENSPACQPGKLAENVNRRSGDSNRALSRVINNTALKPL